MAVLFMILKVSDMLTGHLLPSHLIDMKFRKLAEL